MKVINSRTLVWVLIIAIGGFSAYDQHRNQTQTPVQQTDAKPVCFESTGEDVKPEFKAEGTLIRVNYIDGVMNFNGDPVVGLAKYMYDDELNMTMCEIWIPMPRQVLGDADMDTIGHEVLHCLTGAFHR